MPKNSESAFKISEDLLEKTRRAMISGDFDAFAAHFSIPHTINTYDGRKHIESIDDLRVVFHRVRDHYLANNVTDLVRRCTEAEYRDDHTIATAHETRLISKNLLIEKPHIAFSIVRLIDGKWKITDCQYAVQPNLGLNAALTSE